MSTWTPCNACKTLESDSAALHPHLKVRDYESRRYWLTSNPTDVGRNLVCGHCGRLWDFTRRVWADPLS